MASIFSKEKFDVVHTWQDWCNIYGGIAAISSGIDSLIISGRTMPPSMKSRLQQRSGRSYSDAYKLILGAKGVKMVHNSNCGSQAYANWLGIPSEKFSVIRNGVENLRKKSYKKKDLVRFRKDLGIPKNGFIVGYVGRFNSDKRPWLFLSMAERTILGKKSAGASLELEAWMKQNGEIIGDYCAKSDYPENGAELHFIMVGDGPQLDKARQIVEGSKILSKRIHLVGFSSEVEKYMEIFDCLALTSKVEGLPNAIIEAQFSGVPVLTTNVGGSSECILDGETGIVENDDSASKLSASLVGMITDKEFLTTAGKKAKKFASNEFGEKNWTRKMNNLYSEG